MRYVSLLIVFFLIPISGYSQLKINGSDYLDKKTADSITKVVKDRVGLFVFQNKNKIKKENLDFMSDTLDIETYLSIAKRSDRYSDLGSLLLNQEAQEKYDLILNKYYKILLNKVENKSVLIEAEKAWIIFRDKEINFYTSTITNDISILGSLDKVWIASFSLELTKSRTITIFNYVNR